MKKKLCGAFIQSTVVGDITCANKKPCPTHGNKKEPSYMDGTDFYWVLLCYCTDGDPLICGVYGSVKEAKEANKDVKDCGARHRVKKCRVRVFF